MTKKNALATANNLDVRCDQPYIFAVQVGSGVFSSLKCKGDALILLSLYLQLLEEVLAKLRRSCRDDVRNGLCNALLHFFQDDKDTPPKPPEVLSDKQCRQRAKRTELIVSQLEAVL